MCLAKLVNYTFFDRLVFYISTTASLYCIIYKIRPLTKTYFLFKICKIYTKMI